MSLNSLNGNHFGPGGANLVRPEPPEQDLLNPLNLLNP